MWILQYPVNFTFFGTAVVEYMWTAASAVSNFPANIHLFRVNSRNTRKRYQIMFEVSKKDTRKTSVPCLFPCKSVLWCIYDLSRYLFGFSFIFCTSRQTKKISTAWKCPNTDQKKLHIWTRLAIWILKKTCFIFQKTRSDVISISPVVLLSLQL